MQWNRGDAVISREGLVSHLKDSALHHCRKAIDLSKSPDDFEVVDAAIHAGAAVELLTKMALAQVNPILLAKPSAGPDTALSLLREAVRYLGHGLDGHVKPGPMYTLSAQQALEVAALLHHHERLDVAAAKAVLATRNDAAHMGFGSRTQVGAAVQSMVAYVEHCLSVTREDASSFWGRTDDEAQELLKARADRLARSIREKKTAARTVFRKKAPRAESQEPVRNSGRRREPPSGLTAPEDPMRDVSPVLCHACDGPAWLASDVFIDQEADGFGDVTTLGWVIPLGFECMVCALKYDSEELEFLGEDEFQRDRSVRGTQRVSQKE